MKTLNTYYNELVRKANSYDPLFDEVSENDKVTADDVEYMENHIKWLEKLNN